MKALSIKKISILGAVLVVASAVTAAIVPSKSEKKASGHIENGAPATTDGATCKPGAPSGGQEACTATTATGTTGLPGQTLTSANDATTTTGNA
jgi:hypothetical protein